MRCHAHRIESLRLRAATTFLLLLNLSVQLQEMAVKSKVEDHRHKQRYQELGASSDPFRLAAGRLLGVRWSGNSTWLPNGQLAK